MSTVNPYSSYMQAQQAQETQLNPRQQEALAMEKSNDLLKYAIKHPEDKNAFDNAVRKTQMMWTIFQAQLTEEDHPMDVNTRANVLTLSIFVDKQLFKAAAERSVEPLKPIPNIHTQLALGLRGNPGTGVAQEELETVLRREK